MGKAKKRCLGHTVRRLAAEGLSPPGREETLRKLPEKVLGAYSPAFGGRKVFIIKDIEAMTLDGANAFLKTLEEPAADTMLVLTTSTPENILDTVRSRCHTVYFPSLSDYELAGRLERDDGMTRPEARLYTYFAQGSLEAVEQLQEADFVDGKNDLIDEFVLERPTEDRIKELVKDKGKDTGKGKDFAKVRLFVIRADRARSSSRQGQRHGQRQGLWQSQALSS